MLRNPVHLQALRDYLKLSTPLYRRLTHWSEYVHLKTVSTTNGTRWECRIGNVICMGHGPNDAVADAHRIANSIKRKKSR